MLTANQFQMVSEQKWEEKAEKKTSKNAVDVMDEGVGGLNASVSIGCIIKALLLCYGSKEERELCCPIFEGY